MSLYNTISTNKKLDIIAEVIIMKENKISNGQRCKSSPLIINIEDLPDDLSQLSDDTIIVINEHDNLQDDAFWDSIET